jgi:carboxymethylenebutenolidase
LELNSEWVQFGEHGEYSGYLVQLNGADAGQKPAVIVIQEIWGVDAHIQDVAGRLSEAGYVALAPDLFHQGGMKSPELQADRVEAAKQFLDTIPPEESRDPEARGKALGQLPEMQGRALSETLERIFSAASQADSYLATLAAAAHYLRGPGGSMPPRALAAVGFCLGGMLAGQLATRDTELKAVVVFYGNLPQSEQVAQIHCPMLGIFGEQDQRITDQVPDFAVAMKKDGKRFDFLIYEDAPHTFANDTRASYRPKAAKAAFDHTFAFLHEQLV